MKRGRHLAAWLVALAATGCGAAPEAAPDGTGARQAGHDFYAAMIRQDWPAAYARLHPDSRAAVTAERFTGLAKGFRQRLGFEPTKVAVRTCDEQGPRAIAHVVITGRAPAHERQ